jgi:small subunit ribosomal protein S6
MERYETTLIASPQLSEDEMNQVSSGLEQVISSGGGQVLQVDRWGKRRLAYRIKKFEEGVYTLFTYEASGEIVREVERRIRIDDRMIRFMTVKVDWPLDLSRSAAEKKPETGVPVATPQPAAEQPETAPAPSDADGSGPSTEQAEGGDAAVAEPDVNS